MFDALIERIRSLLKPQTRNDSKINLLIELASFDKGGLEKVVLDSAMRFDRAKFDVTVVSVGKLGHLGDVARQAGLRVVGLPENGKERAYNRILDECRIDLAISHFSHFGYRLLRRKHVPNITFIHNVYAFLCGDALRRFRDDDRFVDLYISVSNKATEYAHQKLGIALDKIVTIPNGLIIEEHEQRERTAPIVLREDLGLDATDYVFLNVASYNLHKGHYLMADAMRKVVKSHPEIKILCIGNVVHPPHIDQLRHYLAEHGLERNILMPGYHPNIESFYQIADAFLLPSFIEGWSIAMNEAMFYGKPMILTDTGGAAQVIENSDIGILVEPEYGDFLELDSARLDQLAYEPRSYRIAQPLADAMVDFATRRKYWAQAGRRGRDKIFANYNFDDIVRRYEQIFFDVVRPSSQAVS